MNTNENDIKRKNETGDRKRKKKKARAKWRMEKHFAMIATEIEDREPKTAIWRELCFFSASKMWKRISPGPTDFSA